MNDNFIHQLEKDYHTINSIGPDAWNFLKKYNNFILEANRNDKMYKLIYNSLHKDHCMECFGECLNTLCYIAKFDHILANS